MKNGKKATLKEQRADALYTKALVLHGNGKLLDFDDDDGTKYRYAQANTRPIIDCPFRSAGCETFCYATKGNHMFPDVKASRERSFIETRRDDFAGAMIYTIEVEKTSKRYADAIMLIRVHESGDFYSLQYLKKYVVIWKHFTARALLTGKNDIRFPLYTKSFPFFNMLDESEKEAIRQAMQAGILAISASLDDTTTAAQRLALLQMQRDFPLLNIYYCSEHIDETAVDNICDCKNCAACGTCNKATGKTTGVKIHSASRADMEKLHKIIPA